MGKKAGPNKENLEATRRVFLQIAHKEFSTKGYYGASTAAIVEESGMARGSLYYHFGDKKGLFKAVYEEAMSGMRTDMIAKTHHIADAWEAFMTGCMTLLDLCMKDELRRIIVDVHTALTYRERYDVLRKTLLEEIQQMLVKLVDAGHFKGHDLHTLMMMVFGLISESGRSFEVSDNIVNSRAMMGNSFTLLMERARG